MILTGNHHRTTDVPPFDFQNSFCCARTIAKSNALYTRCSNFHLQRYTYSISSECKLQNLLDGTFYDAGKLILYTPPEKSRDLNSHRGHREKYFRMLLIHLQITGTGDHGVPKIHTTHLNEFIINHQFSLTPPPIYSIEFVSQTVIPVKFSESSVFPAISESSEISSKHRNSF